MSDNVTISVNEPAPLDVSLSIDAPAVHNVELTVLSGAKGDKGDPGQDGIIGADGADGAQGPAGPAPSGTGIVSVLDGVLQTPSPIAAVVLADYEGVSNSLGLGTLAFVNGSLGDYLPLAGGTMGSAAAIAWSGGASFTRSNISLLSDVALGDANSGQVSLKVQNGGDYSQAVQGATTGNSSFDLSSYGTDKNAQQYTNVSADGGVDTYIEGTNGNNYTYIENVSTSSQVSTEAGSNLGQLFLLNPTITDGSTPYKFNTSLAHTSGNLAEVSNNGTIVFAVDYAGVIQSATISAEQVTGLGSAAFDNSSAFDSAGAATTAQIYSTQRANHTGTQLMATISDAGTLATQSGTFSGTHSGASSGTNTGDQDLSGLLVKASNLSDLASASTARTNLGLGTAATTAASAYATAAQGATADAALAKASNLSDLASATTARTNLGLGTLATQSGTFSGISSGTNTGDQTNISGNAATVTTNANLTGPVTSVGNATTITDAAVTLAKMANLAQDTLIGRQTASTGVPEAITCTAAGRALIDDATATDQRTTLSLGSTDAVAHKTLALSQGSITTDSQAIGITSTWNGSGVAFTGVKLNVTDTASATASSLVDLQVGGTSKLSVRKDGAVLLSTIASDSTPAIAFSSATNTGIRRGASGEMRFIQTGTCSTAIDFVGIFVRSGGLIGFSNSSDPYGTTDTQLARDAAGVLSQYNGSSPQTFRIYNTKGGSSTIYERGFISWSSNSFLIGTEKGSGGGSARDLKFQTDGTTRAGITSTGSYYFGTAALSTSATDGFVYVPTCPGTPTGTPTAITGCAPIVCDSTNNKIYLYSGGAWVALN